MKKTLVEILSNNEVIGSQINRLDIFNFFNGLKNNTLLSNEKLCYYRFKCDNFPDGIDSVVRICCSHYDDLFKLFENDILYIVINSFGRIEYINSEAVSI